MQKLINPKDKYLGNRPHISYHFGQLMSTFASTLGFCSASCLHLHCDSRNTLTIAVAAPFVALEKGSRLCCWCFSHFETGHSHGANNRATEDQDEAKHGLVASNLTPVL